MSDLLPWLLIVAVILAAYPWSAWLLRHNLREDSRWLPWLLALALSFGLLTLLMFWESLLGIRFSLAAATLPYAALMLPGVIVWWRGGKIVFALPRLPRTRWLMLAALALIGAAVLFNAAYWPFSREDTLGIYHRYGALMAESGALVPFQGRDDAFYQAYPMLIPLTYTYAYLASAWVNEYLARLIAALFSLACLPAAFVLGRTLFNSLAGWLAALLLATTPTFVRWVSAGYVDLPMAFFYTLSALFAWRLWDSNRALDAALAGLTMGLAAWTKNAALLGVMLLGLWLVYGLLRRHISLRRILLTAACFAVVAAPWYVRNWLEAGLIVPPTAWTEQAQRSLDSLLIFVTRPQNFGLTGWLVVVAVVAALWQTVRRRDDRTAFLLLWTLPFFVVWWLLVSYDPRFILLFLPLLCVLAGNWAANIWTQTAPRHQKRLQWPLAVLLLALVFYHAWIAVEYKDEILRRPLMSDAEKQELVRGSP